MIDSKIKFIYSDFAQYDSDEQVFYDLSNHPAIVDLKQNFNQILAEISPYLKGDIQLDASNPNAPNVNYPNTWKHVYFMNYMLEYPATRKMFPFTYTLIKKHPEITLAGIASLEAGGRLFPHSGETNAIIRCHLGLQIPGQLPECGLRVKDQHKPWVQGDVVCFNDAFNHEAWNLTSKKRYILLFDVMKPEFSTQRRAVCAYALSIATVRFLAEKLRIDRILPLPVRKIFILPFYFFWRVFLALQNRWINKPNIANV